MLIPLALAFALAAQEPESPPTLLAPGDPAPSHAFTDWLHGAAPAAGAEATLLYFWAPWDHAGNSTMAYVNRMLLRHRGRALAAIAITQPDAQGTKREDAVAELKELDEAPLYSVAWDSEAAAFTAFVRATGNFSFPFAVVVDASGKVAWFGHPLLLDVPVARVLAGTWNYATGIAETEALYQEFRRVARLSAPMLGEEASESTLEDLDAFVARCPERAQDLAEARYHLLVGAGQDKEAHEQGIRLVDAAREARDSRTLNALAWSIANPDAVLEHRDFALALYAATSAAQYTQWQEPWILDTLAAVHWGMEDRARALEIQRAAVRAAGDKASVAEALQRRLLSYETAAR